MFLQALPIRFLGFTIIESAFIANPSTSTYYFCRITHRFFTYAMLNIRNAKTWLDISMFYFESQTSDWQSGAFSQDFRVITFLIYLNEMKENTFRFLVGLILFLNFAVGNLDFEKMKQRNNSTKQRFRKLKQRKRLWIISLYQPESIVRVIFIRLWDRAILLRLCRMR
ncbi:MAG: hypothetical protein U0L08_03885 [Bacteroidales bacterium]|nr:hypothetical protein [Bacteroidales bacterium]